MLNQKIADVSYQKNSFSEDIQQQVHAALLEFLSAWHVSLKSDPSLCELADSLKQAASVSGMVLDLDEISFQKMERFLDGFSEDQEFIFYETGPVRNSSS